MKQDSIISPNAAAVRSVEIRLEKQDWQRIGSDLNSARCTIPFRPAFLRAVGLLQHRHLPIERRGESGVAPALDLTCR
ncbi:MAG: hypothetical protein QOJ15_3346 [Bradyrhizobium sp.]|jgi:hypothetical protein|nr:hypothetical protein [Bradyrhizobium sp.]